MKNENIEGRNEARIKEQKRKLKRKIWTVGWREEKEKKKE